MSKDHLDAQRLADGASHRFANDKCGRKAFVKWFAQTPVERVVFEPTGPYHRAFERALGAAGVPFVKVNPRQWWTDFPLRGGGLLLLLRLWTLWATPSVVHKSTGVLVGLSEVDGLDPVGAIMRPIDAVFVGGAKRDRLPAQGLADPPGPALEADEAVVVDLADLIALHGEPPSISMASGKPYRRKASSTCRRTVAPCSSPQAAKIKL